MRMCYPVFPRLLISNATGVPKFLVCSKNSVTSKEVVVVVELVELDKEDLVVLLLEVKVKVIVVLVVRNVVE